MDGIVIREEGVLRLGALAQQGPYAGLAPRFEELRGWAASRGLIGPGTRFIGLFHDDPDRVPAHRLRSNACLTVPESVQTGEGVRVIHLPAQRLATLVFRGPHAAAPAAYRRIREWLPGSGEQAQEWGPCREEYLNDRRSLPPAEWLTAVMVPLRRR